MENINQLRKERRNCNGEMSRAIKGLQQALESSVANTEIITNLFAKVSNTYEKTEAAHAKLIDAVEDDNMFVQEEKWMEEVQATFISVHLKTESFLKGQKHGQPKSLSNVGTRVLHERENSEFYSRPTNYSLAESTSERNIARAIPEDARRINTRINILDDNISKIILQLVEKHGTSRDLESVRALINGINCIGIPEVELVSYLIAGVQHCGLYLRNCCIPVLPIIKKLVKRPVNDSERENIAANYIADLINNEKYKANILDAYKQWKKSFKATIKELRDTADDLEKDKKIAKAVSTVGSLTSAASISAACCIAALTPSGVFALTALSILGKLVTSGSMIAAHQLEKVALKKSKNLSDNQDKANEYLLELLHAYKQQRKKHMKTAENFDKAVMRFKKLNEDRVRVTLDIGDSIKEEIGFVKSVKTDSKYKNEDTSIKVVSIGGNVIQLGTAAKRLASNVTNDAVKLSIKPAEGAIKVAGKVAGIAIITIDVFIIVKSVLEITKGSAVEAAVKIRQVAQEFEKMDLPELEDAIIQSELESNEDFKVPVVQETN